MYELQYEIVAATNHKDTFELHHKTLNRMGWESTKYAQVPIEILVRLTKRAYILKLQIRSKRYKEVNELQVQIADVDSNLLSEASFTSVSKVFNVTTNDTSVNINKTCRFVKLIILDKLDRAEVAIDIFKIFGDDEAVEKFKQPTNTNKERTDKLLIELGTRLDSPELFDDLAVLPIDSDTRVTLRDLMQIKSKYLMESDYEKSSAVSRDMLTVLHLGKDILSAIQKRDWAVTKDDFKEAKAWEEQARLLKRKRDQFDQIYETSRFDEMVSFDSENSRQDEKFSELIELDKKDYEAYKMREQTDVEKKRQMLYDEYEKAKEDNEPWWEQNIPTDRSINPEPEKQDKSPPNQAKSSIVNSKASSPKSAQKSRQLNRTQKSNKGQKTNLDSNQYDFSNPFLYNQGDADLQRFISPLLTGAKLNPDAEILRKYEQLDYLNILGSRAWLAIHSENWRQRQAAAQSVLSFIQNGIPEKYKNGKSKQLFLALMEFARLCCEDKILQIYYDGLKILGTALAPPICGSDVSPAMVNKVIKDFVPILMEKISEMNSRAKQISLDTLISIFNHPAADLNILIKDLVRIFRQDPLGKNQPADKQPARIVLARTEIAIKMLQSIAIDKSRHNLKEVFDLIAVPSLFHANYEVRMGAVELLGQLFKYLGQPMIVQINDIPGLKPNLQEMIHSKLDQIRQTLKKKST